MNGPRNGRYQRRFTDPAGWPSNRRGFTDQAVERTYERVNALSWELAGHQVADEASLFLAAHGAREERRRTAQAEGWQAGEPGE